MTKKFLFAFLFVTRLTRVIAWFNRQKVTILCYHSVTKQAEPKSNDPHKLHLPFESFVEQLDYLQSHHHLISLSDFVRAHRENRKLPAHTAILTFDDGVRNFLTVVAPLLLDRSIPATSFVVTGENFTSEQSNLNGHWQPEDDDAYLSWTEMRRLINAGIEIGSHTCTHAALPDIAGSEARTELEKSLEMLKQNLKSRAFAVSYPHGRTSATVSAMAQSVGYSCAVTTELGQNGQDANLFELRRTVIAADDDLPTFAARVSGLTRWHNRFIGSLNRSNRLPAKTDRSPNRSYDPMIVDECSPQKTF